MTPLPDDSLEKWEYKEHIQAKHAILDKYVGGWLNILGKTYNLNIFDCFAGRGMYADGSEGSPLIIIKKLAAIRQKMHRPNIASCILIEKNKNNFENLQSCVTTEIESHPEMYNGWLKVECINDDFSNVAQTIIAKYRDNLAPSFFFIDPFGFGGIPFNILKDILAINKSELLINFMVRDVNRFVESTHHQISIEELFGTLDVKKQISTQYPGVSREKALLELYRKQLHTQANLSYSLPFKVNDDEKIQTLYFLIHCTNHPKGCELMKEIMYKVGTEGRFGYYGPIEGQSALCQYDDSELSNYLLKTYAGQRISFEQIRYRNLMNNSFCKADYREALANLENAGSIEILGKGPRGGIKDECMICFN